MKPARNPPETGFKRIYWRIATNKIGSTCEGWFDVPDDADDEEIEEMAREAAFDSIEWNWSLEP